MLYYEMSEFETIKSSWPAILDNVKESNGLMSVSFDTWLRPLELYALINGELIFSVPEEGFIKLLHKKYAMMLKVAVEEQTGIPIREIRFMTKEKAKSYTDALRGKRTIGMDPEVDLKNAIQDANLNPKYTFDTFVVGSSNNLAHAASLAAAESPGEIYNPLYIYGGAGLGKTHLMHSIAHFILRNNPKASITIHT